MWTRRMEEREALAVTHRKRAVERAVRAVSACVEARALAIGHRRPLDEANAALAAAEHRLLLAAEELGVPAAMMLVQARLAAEERLLARYGSDAGCHETCAA